MPYQSSGKVHILAGSARTGWTHSRILYDDKNTVVDSNGFIKQASPVVKVFSNGKYETNDESEGVTVTRLDIGQYLIEGCKALNSDAARAVSTEDLKSPQTGISNRLYGWTTRLTQTALCW